MSKTYQPAPPEVAERAQRLIDKYHADINWAQPKIDFIFAINPEGPAITHGGYPAIGLCKIVGLKDRAMGRGDVEIQLDQRVWDGMTEAQRDALLDHELQHIGIMRDKDDNIKTDDLNRPRLHCKKHDYQFGWFTCIAERHGLASPEVVQAKMLWDENGQAFFPMLMEGGDKPQKAAKRTRDAA